VITRREFIALAASYGATLALGGPASARSKVDWRERRDLFPEGVASGDPEPGSVLLWTRRPFDKGERQILTVEVAEDEGFRRVVAQARAPVSPASDWTARVLVGGLKPARVYWYRFHRRGRQRQPHRPHHHRAAAERRAAGELRLRQLPERQRRKAQRLSPDDLRRRTRAAGGSAGFVLHLGDFIYEVVQYPEEVKHGYDRTIYEVARIPDGGKTGNLHYPLTVDGYRAVYKGYLADPDLQDARAPMAFRLHLGQSRILVAGPQSIVQAGGPPQPGQTVKVAANQAWFEYIPARVSPPSGSLAEFGAVAVKNVKIDKWDETGWGWSRTI
jgi:alkaline phosphatase D